MEVRELAVPGAWEFTPRQFEDARGVFLEWYKELPFAATVGHSLRLAQGNLSVSAAGVVRGIHFADVPPGQAKYVACVSGAVFDVAVDLRVGSPTFGKWDAVLLDDVDRRAVYLSEGLGHAFVSLDDTATMVYVCSEEYSPRREHGVHAFDQALSIDWPSTDRHGHPLDLKLSEKDGAAPSVDDAKEAGLLPSVDAVSDYLASLRG